MTATPLSRRVVVGIDASRHAPHAADWAAAEAVERGYLCTSCTRTTSTPAPP